MNCRHQELNFCGGNPQNNILFYETEKHRNNLEEIAEVSKKLDICIGEESEECINCLHPNYCVNRPDRKKLDMELLACEIVFNDAINNYVLTEGLETAKISLEYAEEEYRLRLMDKYRQYLANSNPELLMKIYNMTREEVEEWD